MRRPSAMILLIRPGLLSKPGERAFNSQFANCNDWVGWPLSGRRSFLPKHYVISNTSGKRKVGAVKTPHLNLCRRSALQPFGHGLPGKGPLRGRNQKYDRANRNSQ